MPWIIRDQLSILGEGKIIQLIMVEVKRNEPHESKSKPVLRGTAPPTQKLPFFVLYLKIISIFFEKQYMNLIVKCPKNSKIASKFR